MKMKRIKSAILSVFISTVAISLITVSADEEVSTQPVPTGSVAVTNTTAASVNVPNADVHHADAGSVMVDPNKLESGEFYNEVMEYVGNENAANLNENLKNNALAINSTTIDYNDKSMFTVTTRSGDVFYLIINNTDGTCLFLNSVDTADLTSLLDKNSGNTNKINDEAVKDIEKIEQQEQQTSAVSDSKASTSADTMQTEAKMDKKGVDWKSNIIWIAAALGISAVIALIAYLFKSKGGRKSSAYDTDFDAVPEDTSDFEEQPEEIEEIEEE